MTIGSFICVAVAVLALIGGGVALTAPALNHIHGARELGYVDVGVRKDRGGEMLWTRRHTMKDSPYKFYATLASYAAAPLALISLGLGGLLTIIVRSVGGPSARPSGALRVLSYAALGVCAVSSFGTMLLIVPLQ